MMKLKDKSDIPVTYQPQLPLIEFGNIPPVQHYLTGGNRIQRAYQIQQGALAGTAGPTDSQ